jgi:hypothetical protein
VKLNELFKRLSYGELSNLAIGSEGVGSIPEDAQNRIVNYTNEALLRLHSRFLLRENLLFIEQLEHLTYYYLLKRFARSQLTDPPCPNTPHLYIIDHEDEPFQDDVIKIMQVIDQEGTILVLNDVECEDSVYTPQPNLLQLPKPVDGQVLAIEYQARHPKLEFDDPCQEIDLPFVLEGALTSYIGYKAYSHMNGQENAAKAMELMQLFEAICTEVEAKDTVSQTRTTTLTKFHARGFV